MDRKPRPILFDNNLIPGKYCSKCEDWYPLTEFHKRGKYVSGKIKYQSWCKKCTYLFGSTYHQKNKVRINQNRRDVYWDDPKKERQINHDQYEIRREKRIEAQKNFVSVEARVLQWFLETAESLTNSTPS